MNLRGNKPFVSKYNNFLFAVLLPGKNVDSKKRANFCITSKNKYSTAIVSLIYSGKLTTSELAGSLKYLLRSYSR